MKSKVYIRADGNTDIGLGHVIRSLALANMIKDDFDCIFVTRFLTDYIENEARKACLNIIKLTESEDHYNEFLSILTGNEIVSLDNYFYEVDFQEKIKAKGCKLVCIDDIHSYHFVADVVINHAGGLNADIYSKTPYTTLYLGTGFALLRPEFLSRRYNTGNSMMISMGGADKYNNTLNILKLLQYKNFGNICYVIIGDSYLHLDELKEFGNHSNLNMRILKNLSAQEMASIMQDCKYAICPPSSISYEYLSIVGGELYLKIIADNQKDIHSFFLKDHLAVDVEDLFMNDSDQVNEILETQKIYFDGKSNERILAIFKNLEKEKKLKLRRATISDLDLYFKWVNDIETRKNALNTNPIDYSDHCIWFNKRINSEESYLWVLEKGITCLGQIRFDIDRKKNEATISYLIDKDQRGKNLGFSILKIGIEAFIKEEKFIKKLIAVVNQSNAASCKLFDKFNFKKQAYAIDNTFYDYALSINNKYQHIN